ncbi:MAG TPA: metallopeptidase TldD-related protein [Thermoanaerobaculia bacterium]|nr:metallopeptidase TldD-related protein [Thermoanaerobaculia bacterium]
MLHFRDDRGNRVSSANRCRLNPVFPDGPVPLAEIVPRLEQLLAGSPADETEISWLEVRRGQESNGKRRRDTYELHERTVLFRVRESGRTGLHRTSVSTLSDLENALRDALAQARLAAPSPALWAIPGGDLAVDVRGTCDPEMARMTPSKARDLLQRQAGKSETARIGWSEGRIAVANSRGLRRAADVTSGWMEVICARQPGAGRAAAASRSLAGLDPQKVFARARRRSGPPEVVRPPEGPAPLGLSQEATAALLEVLNRQAFTSESFHSGVSFLRESLGQPVFHSAVNLRDDAADPRGLPFPFDLLGAACRPLELVTRGVALNLAIDDRLSRALDLPPTAQRVAPDEAVPAHLFLLPGESSEQDLLGAADGGVWVAALEPLEAFDPHALRFRAVARGVRQIDGGALGRSLPDLIWEDDLKRVLSQVLAVGSDLVPIATGAGLFRATTAPMLAVADVAGLRFALD